MQRTKGDHQNGTARADRPRKQAREAITAPNTLHGGRPRGARGPLAGASPDANEPKSTEPVSAAAEACAALGVDGSEARRIGRAVIAGIFRGLVRCPMCGRSVAFDAGSRPCTRCELQLRPRRVQIAIDAVMGRGRRAELAQLLGVSPRTLQRAARGVPISRRMAQRIVEKLGLEPGDVVTRQRRKAGEP